MKPDSKRYMLLIHEPQLLKPIFDRTNPSVGDVVQMHSTSHSVYKPYSGKQGRISSVNFQEYYVHIKIDRKLVCAYPFRFRIIRRALDAHKP